MEKKEFKFSVITPIYMVEEYLEKTIESVVKQTIGFEKNIQLILVNDGSPDNSDIICKKYKEKYPENIIYIEKDNGGVSSARNEGFKYAKGKYVNFLDSDDIWDTKAFKAVYKFFEKYYNDIDVVACRINQFDAVSRLHVLDYKFDNGDRVIDIRKPEDSDKFTMHVTSAFFKKEAIDGVSFDNTVKFGEDSLFINSLILEKAKYGVLQSANYYYRKRKNGSSTIQTQKKDIEYYTLSPKAHYYGVINKSKKLYSKVLPYVQSNLAYDIGWRFKSATPEAIRSNTSLIAEYEALIKDILNYVDEKVILNSKVHKDLRIKSEMLTLRNGKDFYEDTYYNEVENAIFYKDINILQLDKTNKLFKIEILNVEKNKVTLEGVVSKWLFECCPDAEKRVSIFVGKKEIPLQLSDYKHNVDETYYYTKEKFYKFSVEIPIGKRLRKRKVLRVKAGIFYDDKLANLRLSYGKFVPNNVKFKPHYKFYNKYLFICGKKAIKITKPKHKAFTHLKNEISCLNWLVKNKQSKFAIMRIKYYFFSHLRYRHKKIWLISDRMDKARDNAEYLFKFLRENPNVDKSIVPIFAISKDSVDVERIKQIGKVIYFDDKKYINYFLASDKVISSTCGEYTINPFEPNEKIYINDLLTYKYVFLQHGIIINDLSKWLCKFNKNIDIFVTSAKHEYDSVVNGDYGYTEKQVKLTGMPRYDMLHNDAQKQVVIIPTWRNSIKAAFDNNTRSVYYKEFKKTKYFKFFNSLINNERLLECLKNNGYSGLFCLHPIHAKQYVDFKENDVFKVNKGFVDYQDVFSKSSLLVTDYSSVSTDFAYLRKPIVYAQFDFDTFFDGANYKQGYFNYKNDGFGPVACDLESTVDEIIKLVENNCKIDDKYLKRINEYFAFNDKNNSMRVYQEIINL